MTRRRQADDIATVPMPFGRAATSVPTLAEIGQEWLADLRRRTRNARRRRRRATQASR